MVNLLPTQKRHSNWPSFNLGLVAILVSFGSSFNFGFQLLITNPAQQAFLRFLNESKFEQGVYVEDEKILENEWSFIVAIFFLGSFFGAWMIRDVAERFGRKKGLIFSVLIQVIACFLAVLSYFLKSHQTFTISRFLIGLGITMSMGISSIFITESSPNFCRGRTSLLNGIILQFAIIIGSIAAMPQLCGTAHRWYLLYVVEACTSLGVLVALCAIHESPGYLCHRGRLRKAARAVEFYHCVSFEQAINIVENIVQNEETQRHKAHQLWDVWRDAFSRRGTVLGMMVTMAMAMTGISVLNAFAFEILLNTGLGTFEASLANVFICTFSLFGILISTRFIDKHGRRPLLLITFTSLALINILIVALMYTHTLYSQVSLVGVLLVGAICAFNFIFAMGPGPISLFISGELVEQTARSSASTWANVMMAGCRFFCLASYLPLKNATTEYQAYATFFILPVVLVTIFLYFTLPETRGKSADEIRDEFEKQKLLLSSSK